MLYRARLPGNGPCRPGFGSRRENRYAGVTLAPMRASRPRFGNGTRITDIETRPISPCRSSNTPLPAPRPAAGRHLVCGANADPFAGRRPEQLNRQVRVGIGHHVLDRPRDAMGPVGRSQEPMESGPAPVDDRHGRRRNQATSSPARASMASMNQGRPCDGVRRRSGNRVGIGRLARRDRQTRDLDRALARQRHPDGGAGLVLVRRPQRVVDHADAAAFADDRKLRPQIRHRRRPQEPGRG